jgi:hypothetical protein
LDPDPTIWLELDEAEQTDLVLEYHRRARERLQDALSHASFHVAVENQLALGLPGAADALRRLQDEGLDRHDAIHAMAYALIGCMYDLFDAGRGSEEVSKHQYRQKLNGLTAEEWRRSADE